MWQLARSPEKRGCQAFFQRTPPARQPNRIGKEWQNSREIVGTLVFWQSEWRAGYPEGCLSRLAELGWQVWLRGAIGALLRSYHERGKMGRQENLPRRGSDRPRQQKTSKVLG